MVVDRSQIADLRAEGLSWAKIAANLEVGEGTVYRMAQASAKIPTNSPHQVEQRKVMAMRG